MPKAPAMFMETTQTSDTNTVAKIQHLLANRGAKRVTVEYDGARVAAVDFQYTVNGNDVPFRLPCRWEVIMRRLRNNGRRPRSNDTIENWARRVAWRQILRWVEAQLALIDTGMAKTQEVFLPYAIMFGPNGETKTMFQHIEEHKFMALPAHEKENTTNG